MRMLEPTSKIKDAAICVTAKIRSLRLVLPVMRTLLLVKPIPVEDSDEGRRGTNASSTAATIASPAPTHTMLKSTFKSSARTEKREAYPASTATIGRAIRSPSAAPATLQGRSGDHWYGCADGGLPIGHRDVAAGRAAGDPYTAQLCASRRYLWDRLDALGRQAFAAAFAACGIG